MHKCFAASQSFPRRQNIRQWQLLLTFIKIYKSQGPNWPLHLINMLLLQWSKFVLNNRNYMEKSTKLRRFQVSPTVWSRGDTGLPLHTFSSLLYLQLPQAMESDQRVEWGWHSVLPPPHADICRHAHMHNDMQTHIIKIHILKDYYLGGGTTYTAL